MKLTHCATLAIIALSCFAPNAGFAVCESVFRDSNPLFQDSPVLPTRYDILTPNHLLSALKLSTEMLETAIHDAAFRSSENSFHDTVAPVLLAAGQYDRVRSTLGAMQNLLGTPEYSKALLDAEVYDAKRKQLFFQSIPLYRKWVALRDSDKLSAEERFIVSDWIRNAEMEGVALSSLNRNRLGAIDSELTVNIEWFRSNFKLAQEQTLRLPLDTQFEEGIPATFLEEARMRGKREGHEGYSFLLKPHNIDQLHYVLEYASSETVRKQMFEAFTNRAQGKIDNRPIIREIVNLRLKRAKLLGLETFSDSVLPFMMAGSVEKVRGFLKEVTPDFHQMALEELKEIAALKKELTGTDELPPWDVQFYAKKLEIRLLAWDANETAPYLEVNGTLERSLELIGKVFDLEFRRRKNIPIWHPDVVVFEVRDRDTRQSRGFIYFDLLQRANKVPNAFASELRAPGLYPNSSSEPNWRRAEVLVSLGLELTRGPEGLSFFSIRDLQSLFHETGHALHSLLSKSSYPTYSSFHVPYDLRELPSQLLENAVYVPEVFEQLARHYKTGEPFPRDWLLKLPRIRRVHPAITSLARRAIMTELDLAWHTITEPVLANNGTESGELTLIDGFEAHATRYWADIPYLRAIAGTSTTNTYIFQNGYESCYHCYQWCQFHDADAFGEFLRDSRAAGARFKETIFSKGAIIDPAAAYREFCGRDADPKALVKKFKR